jgi:hypothetical protein
VHTTQAQPLRGETKFKIKRLKFLSFFRFTQMSTKIFKIIWVTWYICVCVWSTNYGRSSNNWKALILKVDRNFHSLIILLITLVLLADSKTNTTRPTFQTAWKTTQLNPKQKVDCWIFKFQILTIAFPKFKS